jgi:hypothetical protein
MERSDTTFLMDGGPSITFSGRICFKGSSHYNLNILQECEMKNIATMENKLIFNEMMMRSALF